MSNGMDDPTNSIRDSNRGGTRPMKRYEEMLVKSMLGTSRPNEPLQAVIENQLNENALTEKNNSVLERNRALLQYVATLANSNSNTDEFNYEFVESLVTGGADINTADQYQQTIFHEVARAWNTDVAQFLLDLGCDINKQDSFGRSPLHVAAAVDYAEMTEFLLINHADIDARTFGEEQASIHYAAKNGAVKSLRMLLGFRANINSLDAKQRTPLQLAAEWTRGRAVEVLLDEGASACLLDSSGNSALSVLIDRLPNFALEALNQLHTTDVITMKESYYLQHLEASRLKVETKNIRTPLDTAVATRKYEVVTHPVMQRLIYNKWVQYGQLSTIIELLFHVVYGVLWTIICVGTPETGKAMWEPPDARIELKVVGTLIAVMTLYDIYIQIHATMKSRKSQKNWVNWRIAQLEDEIKYCHPRWPQEQKYINLEIKRVKSLPLLNAFGAWFYLEWIILFLILATSATNVVYFMEDNKVTRYIYTRTISIANLLVWLRLLKYVRPFPGIGTLVVILGETVTDFVNWAFLFFLLLIPFTAAFWINFGEISMHPVEGYEEGNRLLYSVFRIAVGDEFNFEGIAEADPVMSRILVVLYVTAMTIVTLNLLIALLTDTFSRVYSNAVANTIMQRAIKVVNAERTLTKKGKMKYREYMGVNCSPEVLDLRVNEKSSSSTETIAENEFHSNLINMSELLCDRFGTVYGKNKTSDFDAIIQDIKNLRLLQEEMANDLKTIYEMLNNLAGHGATIDNHTSRRENGDGKGGSHYKSHRRGKRGSKRSESDKEDSKTFIETLQEKATSLIQSLLSAKETDDGKSSSSRSKRTRGSKSEREPRERGRRRRRRTVEKDSDDDVFPTKGRKRRRPKQWWHTDESNAGEQDSSDFSLTQYGARRQRTAGERQPQVIIEEPELAWDNISIDSVKM